MKAIEFNCLWILISLLCCQLLNTAEHEDVVKHAIKLHRGKGAAVTHRKQWVLENCRKLSGLLRQKNVVLNKLKNAIRSVEKDLVLSDEEKLFQVHTFEIFQKELNESENSVFQAIHGLQRALQGDYKDVVNMKESSRQRLEALREAAIKEETEYIELLAAEKHQVEALKNMQHQNKSLSILDEILEDVRKAADRLEEEIEEHAFDDNKSVWKISLQGPCYMTLLMIAFGLLWGHLLQIRPTQSVFISTCLSLSSTPLVSRFLVGCARGDKEGDIDYSSVLLGMLVMQDVQLGLFIAVMPTLIQAGASTYSSIVMEILRILILIGQILFFLAAVFLICLVIKTYLIGPYYRKLHAESKGNKEILILGISAFIFLMLTITELLDVSMELGCFLAGALISSQGHMITEEVMSCIEPIRDFLAIIFFASIGLHVFPTFVIYELTVLLFLTLSVVIMKFVLAVLVLSLILPKSSQYIKWIVSAGLAQVSEFSFVLGSRARRAGIISREVYLLILSVTTLSLLLAPALWRAAIMKCVPRPERRSST